MKFPLTISICFINNIRRRELLLDTRKFRTEAMAFSSRNDIPWVQSLATDNSANDKIIQLSIFSWNVLAQHLFDQTQHWYTHVASDAPVHSWPDRFVRVLHELSQSQADIICLQEVELDAFHLDFLPSLQKIGYEGVMQTSKRNKSTHGYGVATFWKSARFQMKDVSRRSRTMITTLQDKRSSIINGKSNVFAIINCHLEGSPHEYVKRVKQLQNALSELSSKFSHHNLVVCGDMNCNLGGSICTTYLQLGCIPEDIELLEWGQRVSLSDSILPPPHKYSLHTAYPMELASDDLTDYITYVSRPGHYAVGLDQIWFHKNNTMKVIGLKHPFHSKDQQKIINTGLPSELHPSDHLPIGCILEWESNIEADDLCVKEKSEITPTRLQLTPTEMKLEALELFNACNFDTKDRSELQYIITPVSGLPEKGKPNNDQLEQLKDKRMRKSAFLSKVSDEMRQMLEKGIKLLKDADKIEKL